MSEKAILYNQRKLFRKHLLAKKNLSVILNDAFCLAKMGVSNDKKMLLLWNYWKFQHINISYPTSDNTLCNGSHVCFLYFEQFWRNKPVAKDLRTKKLKKNSKGVFHVLCWPIFLQCIKNTNRNICVHKGVVSTYRLIFIVLINTISGLNSFHNLL
jgi:hypothetical protein